MEELYAKFLPQFVELARERLQRAAAVARTVAQQDEATLTAVVRDLHAIAGEAGLLGMVLLVPLARSAEDHAKRLRDRHAEADATALLGALKELEQAVEVVSAGFPPKEA